MRQIKAKLNSNLFPIISVGMYNSHISPENIFDSYTLDQDFEEGYTNFDSEYYWDKFDNNLYVQHVQDLAVEYIEDLEADLQDLLPSLKIKAGEIYSPKYYNFATDNIDLEVELDLAEVLAIVSEERDSFDDFLRANYSSYDGFLSHTANNYNEWLKDVLEENEQALGAALTYIFADEIERCQHTFFDLVNDRSYYSEFMDYTEIDEEIARVEKYVKDNYPNVDPSQVYDVLYELEEFNVLKPETVERITKEIFKEIESNTPELF